MADNKLGSEKLEHEMAESSLNPAPVKENITAEDPELDDLLDSALEDFDKPPPASAATAEPGTDLTPSITQPGDGADTMAMFEQVFSSLGSGDAGGDMQQQIADAMKAMMGDDPEMMATLDHLAHAASTADESEESQKVFTDTLQGTLDSLSQNAQNMQGGMSEEDMMRAMSGLGLEDPGPVGELDFMPMMQGMLQSLLSKDVLYPSLKEIAEKYPGWLSEHKSSLSESEFSNYEQQYSFTRQICETFEEEKDSDSDEAKAQRFTKIMNFMQQMQTLGQPPKEIAGEMMPGIEFDADGNPQLPNMGQQCSVM